MCCPPIPTRLARRPLLVATAAAGLLPAAQANPTLRLATLEWPPYTGAHLPGQGASSEVLRQALRAVGLDLQLGFMPWARALAEGSAGASYLGYFPAYASEERDRLGLRSARIGSSRVGLAYRRGAVLPWRHLEELGSQRIGTVRGTVLPEAMEALMQLGRLRSLPAVSDEENLRKLAFARIDVAVVDEAVFHALTAAGGPLAAQAERLTFDSQRPLAEKSLHVYLQRHEAGQRALAALDQGLASIPVAAVFRRALADEKKQP